MTAYDKTFDDIRPFTDQEAIAALPKAIRIPYLEQVIRYGLPDLTPEQLKRLIASCTSVRDFIEKAIYPAVQRLLDQTSEGVTFPGLGALDKAAQVTKTTILAAVVQVVSLLLLIATGHFTVMWIAIFRCVTEFVLMTCRGWYCWKYRKEFC